MVFITADSSVSHRVAPCIKVLRGDALDSNQALRFLNLGIGSGDPERLHHAGEEQDQHREKEQQYNTCDIREDKRK